MRRLLERVEKVLLGCAAASMLLMMALLSTDALGRHMFNHPIPGSFEVTRLYLMVTLVFGALSATHAAGAHVALNVFRPRLEQTLGRIYPRLIALMCLPVFLLLALAAGKETVLMALRDDRLSGPLPLPMVLSYGWVALGAATLCLRLVLDVVSPRHTDHDA